jgi:hypothetical protein
MDSQRSRDAEERAGTGRDARPEEGAEGRVSFGGGFQPGGGMVEPDEFSDATRAPALPNDALTEGDAARPRPASGADGPIDPDAAPDDNDTGTRMGDVAGYRGSDRVVGVDPSRLPEDRRAEH